MKAILPLQKAIPLPQGPLGLYIHIPFCRKACHYCDFYFTVRASLMPAYVERLCEEIAWWRPWLTYQPIQTAYFGGGTPSWLPPRLLEAIAAKLKALPTFSPVEWTLEVNPEDVSPQNLLFWKQLGITRLSVGVQSLDENVLRTLGRPTTLPETYQALETIAACGWPNWSVDLIFAVPGLTLSLMEKQLSYLTHVLKVPHLSLYGLTIEPRTVLYKKYQSGRFLPVSDDVYAEMYAYVSSYLANQGYKNYEISNWALPGYESKHNLIYWTGRPYIGLGPSAHSYIYPYRWWGIGSIQKYLYSYFSTQYEIEYISPEKLRLEWWLLNLRLSNPIFLQKAYANVSSIDVFSNFLLQIADEGLAILDQNSFSLTVSGRLLVDSLARKISITFPYE